MSRRSSVRRSRPSGTAEMDRLGMASPPSPDPDRALAELGGQIDSGCVVCQFVAEAVERRAFFIFVEAVGEPWFIAKMRAGGFCGPHVRDLVASGRGPRLTGPFEDVLEGWLARRRALGGSGLPAVGEACPICETAAWAADHALGLLASGDPRRIEVGLGRSEPLCLPHLDELIDRLPWPERVAAAHRWAERLLEAVALATRAELEGMTDGEGSRSARAGCPPASGPRPAGWRSGKGADAVSRAPQSAVEPEPLAAATGAVGASLAGVVDILAGSQSSLRRRMAHQEGRASQPEEGPAASDRSSPPTFAARAAAARAAPPAASPESQTPTLAEAWHDGLITEAGLAAELAAGRCPVCTAVAAAPRRLLAWLAVPASTDRDRRDLDAFCGDHLRDLVALAPVSAASVVRSALERRLAMLAALPTIADQPPGPIVARVGWAWRRTRARPGDEPPASRLTALREIWRVLRWPGDLIEERLRRARLAADRECVACLAAVTARRRTSVLLATTLRGRRGRDRFELSGGLCLRHAAAAHAAAAPAATSRTGAAFDAAGLALVAAVAEARCAAVLFELGEALRKSSWSVRFEPPGPEGTAWQRAATFVLGEAALPSAAEPDGPFGGTAAERVGGAAPEPARPRRAV